MFWVWITVGNARSLLQRHYDWTYIHSYCHTNNVTSVCRVFPFCLFPLTLGAPANMSAVNPTGHDIRPAPSDRSAHRRQAFQPDGQWAPGLGSIPDDQSYDPEFAPPCMLGAPYIASVWTHLAFDISHVVYAAPQQISSVVTLTASCSLCRGPQRHATKTPP